MVMHDVRPKKTVDDYLALPDDSRVELMDGEFFVSPAPNLRHQRTLGKLFTHLAGHASTHRIGEVVLAPFDCVLSRENVVQPDVLFVREDRLSRDPLRLHGAPDLAIEILSPGHAERDRIVKRDLYSKYGVPEFWIVDPDAKTIEVLRLESGSFRLFGWFEGDEKIASPTFPELNLSAKSVFV